MYTQADMEDVMRQLKQRWFRVLLPCALLLAAVLWSFFYCQGNRYEWGWLLTSGLTIVMGGLFLFFYGVYIRPMLIYRRHLDYMLHGRTRETTGIVKEVETEPCDKEGLLCYRVMLNIGKKDDGEDDRLFYFDAQKGLPPFKLGDRVTLQSNDKVIAGLKIA